MVDEFMWFTLAVMILQHIKLKLGSNMAVMISVVALNVLPYFAGGSNHIHRH